MRCVKPSWKHCATCKRCCLPSHVCGEFVPSQLCFNCGQPGHKKRDCPSFSCDAAIRIKPYSTTQLNPMKIVKKRKCTENKNDEEKQVFTNVSSKKQKLQNVNSKKSRINMKKKKKRKTRMNISRRQKLQF